VNVVFDTGAVVAAIYWRNESSLCIAALARAPIHAIHHQSDHDRERANCVAAEGASWGSRLISAGSRRSNHHLSAPSVLAGLHGSNYCLFVPVNYQNSIERRPQICGGEPVVKGTRVTLRTILASLAEGATIEQIIADFPTVSPEAVRAIIAFAAASAEEDLPVPPVPSPA